MGCICCIDRYCVQMSSSTDSFSENPNICKRRALKLRRCDRYHMPPSSHQLVTNWSPMIGKSEIMIHRLINTLKELNARRISYWRYDRIYKVYQKSSVELNFITPSEYSPELYVYHFILNSSCIHQVCVLGRGGGRELICL